MEGIQQIRNILKGNLNPVIQRFKNEMKEEAARMHFEKAEIIRKKISHMEQYAARSVIVSSQMTNADVFTLLREEDNAYVNYLMVQNGTIVQTHTSQLETHLEEPDEEVLAFAIAQLRDTFNSLAGEIVVPFPIEYPEKDIIITVPKAGDKKKLLDLSEKNVSYFREELRKKRMLQLEGKDDMEKKKVLYTLQEDLKLPDLPVHIECFDNSNFQGSYPVSAMVCFRMGIPSKDDYRHYNVKTVQGINDFATMKEVVLRRYKRLTEEEQPLPQLVIIDGGKGQLSAAMESIEALGLQGRMTVVGLAKNEEEIFYAGDQQSLKLPYNSPSLHLIRRIRDEVHRFGIRFHRQKRSQGTFKNELEQIKGIGKSTADQLLKTFRSVKKIRELSREELYAAAGTNRGLLIWNFFHPEESVEPPPDMDAIAQQTEAEDNARGRENSTGEMDTTTSDSTDVKGFDADHSVKNDDAVL
jgi:excinuclease ABC subunit C